MFWDLTNPSEMAEYTMSVEIIIDCEDEDVEVEVGSTDPQLDDPTLSFSTITASHTSTGEGDRQSRSEDELSTSTQISGLSKLIEQNSKPSLHKPPQVKSLMQAKIGNYRIPKRSHRDTPTTDTSKSCNTPTTHPSTDTPNRPSDVLSSPMLTSYFEGRPLHKEGVFYHLSGPGGFQTQGSDLQGSPYVTSLI